MHRLILAALLLLVALPAQAAIDALEVGGIETAAVSTRLQDVHVYVEYTEAVTSSSGSLMMMGVGR